MHPRLSQVMERALVAASLLLVTLGVACRRGRMIQGFWAAFSVWRWFVIVGLESELDGARTRPAPLPYGRDPGRPGEFGPGSSAGSPCPMTLSNFGGLPQSPVTTPPPAAAGPAQRLSPRPRVSPAVTTADPALDAVRAGPFQRRQPVRHVPSDLRRRHGHRLRGRPPPSAGRSQADRRSGSIGRTVPGPGPLRRSVDRFHRVCPRRGL